MKQVEKTIDIGGRKLTISTGHLATQSDAAILASYGDTVVLATVVSSKMLSNLGYFPLTVEYMERLYAGGKIKGSRWVKREGRSTDEEILRARLVDRAIRPLFPKDYMNDVQVILTVLSVDLENDPSVLSSIAASAALAISSIPWNGPVGTVRVGVKDGTFVTNPKISDLDGENLDLVVSATDASVLMVEAGAKEVKEETVIKGIDHAQKEIKKIIGLINDLVKEVGKEKQVVEKVSYPSDLKKKVEELVESELEEFIKKTSTKQAGEAEYDEMKNAVIANFPIEDKAKVATLFDDIVKARARKTTLSGKRSDGRKPEEIRELAGAVGILPRTHGSALFQRGQTQVLSVATLGAPSLGQLFESAEGEEEKHYIHHYSMPPYATGQTGKVGFPSRREIGHGALAERALVPVIPEDEKFPYTIRVVSEVLSSNGSTSMASVCGSTLSLMDAGVPLVKPVAGIAMGLVIEDEKKFTVLTDITGFEDQTGDMDFKVAGTEEGITALQLDVKTTNLTLSIMETALSQAKEARMKILEVIKATIDKPRDSVSTFAPKIKLVKVAQDKIGEVIGPGGRVIRKIQADTGAQVEIEDDGTVAITATTDESLNAALAQVDALTRDVMAGEIYEGEVKRIQPFGAFVEVLPGKEGLVHVSDMSEGFVNDPADVVKVGDKIKVRVKEIDNLGRINLSMLLSGDKEKTQPRGEGGGGFRGRSGGGFRRERTSGGPSFPASRFLPKDRKRFSR